MTSRVNASLAVGGVVVHSAGPEAQPQEMRGRLMCVSS